MERMSLRDKVIVIVTLAVMAVSMIIGGTILPSEEELDKKTNGSCWVDMSNATEIKEFCY